MYQIVTMITLTIFIHKKMIVILLITLPPGLSGCAGLDDLRSIIAADYVVLGAL